MRSSYGWLVSNTVDECLPKKIAKKIFKSKIDSEARPVNASNIAFHLLLIWLQNLVEIDEELRLTLFPSF